MPINFQNIRPWNGSQNIGFEELCSQLAEYEPIPSGSTFFRKAAPDAGVECFWKLPNDKEWGWQSKFFLHPPNENQWSQIDNSVKKALEKHTHLTSYTICLPIDRQDPRIDSQMWFMDKWHSHVKKWKVWAQKKGMSVDFKYWGDHEIWERLNLEEHRGRHFFWFKKELFSRQWFENRIEEVIANVGPRYSPELNVDLPIAQLFDGLGRSSEFFKRIKVYYRKIKKTYTNASSRRAGESARDEFKHLQESVDPILSIMEGIEKSEVKCINWESIIELTTKSIKSVEDCIRKLEEIRKEQKPNDSHEGFGYERHYLIELMREIRSLYDFAQSSEANLSNLPALLLIGDAGTGKTHLFCDVAKQRVNFGLPTVLLLGGHFNNNEPWSQIVRLLGLSCTPEEFLGALDAATKARGTRSLILIDALNEGEGKYLWNKFLAGILTTLSRYPWIGIAVSARTSYEKILIPEGLIPNKLIREIHHGFADYEYEATKTFFDYFDIAHPTIPLLIPEFRNPLFLKLFCQGLKNCGYTRVPPGLRGISAIFNFFIDSVNAKLSKPEHLNFDSNSRIVHKAVDKLAKLMANTGRTWLLRNEAQTAVNEFLPHKGYEDSLFRHMISEGVLAEDRFRIENEEWREGIHFSYDRFADHLITKYLLDEYLDPKNPSRSFLVDQPLGSLVTDEWSCWRNQGLIEAFSVQLPERINKELTEVAPHCVDYGAVRESFVESLIWRNPKTITESTRNYINEYVIKNRDTHDKFFNALLTVSSNPDHPYNGDFFHEHLMKYKLAERDAWWSIFLHYQYGEHGAVDRLVDWAWSSDDKSHINDESIRLCGVTLTWFLTTSNRFLRDRATKALISILKDRIHVLRRIISDFLGVNDPYVLERLFAVAYGCTMLSTDIKAIGKLAKDVYDWIFEDGEPPPHILLRDYARGVVELTLHRGIELDINVKKIRPPYKSEWPLFEIPIEEELKKYGTWEKDMPDEEWSRVHLYNSVMGFEDFARYIIGTKFGRFEWSSRRLDEPRKPSRKLDESFDPHKNEYRFDLSIAQRWIFQKVLNLDWTVERFGRFDRNLTRYSHYGRSAHKPERIGKKYQWMAYHEFLARISDNFEFREDPWSDRPDKYEGAWQMYLRDIDPSFLLRKTGREAWQPHTNTWWFPSSYNA